MSFIKFWGAVTRGVIYPLVRFLYRPEIELENGASVHCDEPVVYISNHISCWDPLLLLTVLGVDKVSCLAAKDWYDKPFIHSVYEANNWIPVNRRGFDTAWLHLASEAMKEGRSILIFPEGHIRREAGVDEFKPGFMFLTSRTHAKIVPIWHSGYRLFHRTRVVFKKLQPTDGSSAAFVREECIRYREMFMEMEKENSK